MRDCLSSLLSTGSLTIPAGAQATDLVAAAVRANVSGLVDACLVAAEAEGSTRDLRQGIRHAARAAAVQAMFRESECKRALKICRGAGIRVLLLKGMSLAYSVYPAPFLRESCDIDLLFPTREVAEQFAAMVSSDGYALVYEQGEEAHGLLCRRKLSGGMHIDMDLHWQLVNSPMFAQLFTFDELYSASMPLPALESDAVGLSLVHAFVHGCLHRALNLYTKIGDGLKWLYDLHLLAARFTSADWDCLVEMSRSRGVSGVCAEGIAAAQLAFETRVPIEVMEALRRTSSIETLDASRLADWKYMERLNLAAMPSLSGRARWLLHRLFPPLSYLRELYGPDKGALQLVVERARRALDRLR